MLLVFAFFAFILPSTQKAKNWLDNFEKKTKDDLEKLRNHQRELDIQAQRRRLFH